MSPPSPRASARGPPCPPLCPPSVPLPGPASATARSPSARRFVWWTSAHVAAPCPCSALPPSGARPPRGPVGPCPGSAGSGGPCTHPPCDPSQPGRCPRSPDGWPALWLARGGNAVPISAASRACWA
eukprot:2516430-Pleurochrysis_carterae.AAC.1